MALQLVREVWKNAATGEEGERWIEMDVATPEEQAAADAQANAQAATESGNDLTLRQQADAALANLRAYRDLAGPTNVETVQAVKLLCRVAIGLIRLVLRKLDSAD